MHRRFSVAGRLRESYPLRFNRKRRCIAALQKQPVYRPAFRSDDSRVVIRLGSWAYLVAGGGVGSLAEAFSPAPLFSAGAFTAGVLLSDAAGPPALYGGVVGASCPFWLLSGLQPMQITKLIAAINAINFLTKSPRYSKAADRRSTAGPSRMITVSRRSPFVSLDTRWQPQDIRFH